MQKNMRLIFPSQLLTVLLMSGMASPTFAFAATTQGTIARTATVHAQMHEEESQATPGWLRPKAPFLRGRQENNQHLQSCRINSDNKTYQGSDQGNSGNSKYNGDFNQDNSTNDGNEIINQHGNRGHRQNNQSLRSCSIGSDNLFYRGHNQGNSGNDGYNRGFNQDNSANNGNQIIN